jgi:hypothetical protein
MHCTDRTFGDELFNFFLSRGMAAIGKVCIALKQTANVDGPEVGSPQLL